MHQITSDIAFTPGVKAIQSRRGSRASYQKAAATRPWPDRITPELAAFIAERDSAYLATVNEEGQPYIQHRGGPKGFIHVLDDKTLAFADYRGNRQYVTTGNLAGNDRAFLFLMDYAERRRIKIWGRARIVDDDPALLARLMPEGYRARPEQALLFTVEAWDVNCPQHIPRKLDEADVVAVVGRLQARIAELEAQLAARAPAAAGVKGP